MGVLKGSFLILDWYSIIHKHELHRLLTSFLFFGPLSLNWIIFVLVNTKYLISLEKLQFMGRKSEFIVMLLYIMLCCYIASAFIRMPFPSLLLFGAITYIWTRYHPDDMLVVMQILPVRA